MGATVVHSGAHAEEERVGRREGRGGGGGDDFGRELAGRAGGGDAEAGPACIRKRRTVSPREFNAREKSL